MSTTEEMMEVAQWVTGRIQLPANSMLDENDVYQEACVCFLECVETGNMTTNVKRKVENAVIQYVNANNSDIQNGLMTDVVIEQMESYEESRVIKQYAEDALKTIMDELPRHWATVLTGAFGLYGVEECDRKTLAEQTGLSERYISALKKRAVRRCRWYAGVHDKEAHTAFEYVRTQTFLDY